MTGTSPEATGTDGGRAYQQHSPVERWFELFTVVVLSLTAVLTAWSGFQSTKWSGEQAANYSAAGANRTESVRFANRAAQQTAVDVNLLTEWLDATAAGDAQLADFYRARFRDEFAPAFEEWLASDPLTNPDAPASPFELSSYQLAAASEATRLEATADERAAEATEANDRGDQYVLMTVLFALVLFFGAMSERFETRPAREILLGLAVMGFLVGLGFSLFLPTRL